MLSHFGNSFLCIHSIQQARDKLKLQDHNVINGQVYHMTELLQVSADHIIWDSYNPTSSDESRKNNANYIQIKWLNEVDLLYICFINTGTLT